MRLGKRERLALRGITPGLRARKHRKAREPQAVQMRSRWDWLWPVGQAGALRPNGRIWHYAYVLKYQREQSR